MESMDIRVHTRDGEPCRTVPGETLEQKATEIRAESRAPHQGTTAGGDEAGKAQLRLTRRTLAARTARSVALAPAVVVPVRSGDKGASMEIAESYGIVA